MIPDPITFYANGTYQTPYGQGTWIARVYNPGYNLYWNNPPYELWLTDSNTGMVRVRGLVIHRFASNRSRKRNISCSRRLVSAAIPAASKVPSWVCSRKGSPTMQRNRLPKK